MNYTKVYSHRHTLTHTHKNVPVAFIGSASAAMRALSHVRAPHAHTMRSATACGVRRAACVCVCAPGQKPVWRAADRTRALHVASHRARHSVRSERVREYLTQLYFASAREQQDLLDQRTARRGSGRQAVATAAAMHLRLSDAVRAFDSAAQCGDSVATTGQVSAVVGMRRGAKPEQNVECRLQSQRLGRTGADAQRVAADSVAVFVLVHLWPRVFIQYRRYTYLFG